MRSSAFKEVGLTRKELNKAVPGNQANQEMIPKPKLLGTNILVSTMVFPGNERKLLDAIITEKLGLDVIDEANAVFQRKFLKQAVLFPLFLALGETRGNNPKARTKNLKNKYAGLTIYETDVPILAAAVVSGAIIWSPAIKDYLP